MHWTDYPNEFITNQAKYIEEDAIIFEKIDFFIKEILTRKICILKVNLIENLIKVPREHLVRYICQKKIHQLQ